ncbi:unnamed protein product [Lymnaea stagnalis]|uniref:Uncharacterized protein n=1 Tax=Lymnaea stagnalis TaxID=6523 RepID=A0AAV2IJI4_LYMST
MSDKEDYRSKLRTPNKDVKNESPLWGGSSPLDEFGSYPNFLNTPSPPKRKHAGPELQSVFTPHKSGYLLRTPSPHKSSPAGCVKTERNGTPSPHKAGSGTDLFGNRSLLDNLPIPDWDDIFLESNFQEDLFGLVNEDLEGLVKSPSKSPRKSHLLNTNSPFRKTSSPCVSPFKNPLLTSSPKSIDSPGSMMKTPGVAGGRPLTRQRKLFLQSPERPTPPLPMTTNIWPAPLPFTSLDDTSSSMFSEGGNETTTSTQSISTYLKQLDEEDNEDFPVMLPSSWTNQGSSTVLNLKSNSKGKGKSLKQKHNKSFNSSGTNPSNPQNTTSLSTSVSNTSGSKKSKVEPQFTLLRPHTELFNNQICLRMTPRTPPNKIKISRDFSQIQTLPSKEQLRIVRNRFSETLKKAVEDVIEKEKKVQEQNDNVLRTALQEPVISQPINLNLMTNYNVHGFAAKKPQLKRKKR